jgi:hypothetical protein
MPITGNCFIELLAGMKRHAKHVVCARHAWCQMHGFPAAGFRLGEISDAPVQPSEV